jgi:hypothetical protein
MEWKKGFLEASKEERRREKVGEGPRREVSEERYWVIVMEADSRSVRILGISRQNRSWTELDGASLRRSFLSDGTEIDMLLDRRLSWTLTGTCVCVFICGVSRRREGQSYLDLTPCFVDIGNCYCSHCPIFLRSKVS